jgi:hypothetical protein
VWLEGPAALGWHRRRGLNLAEAPEEEKPRLRDEWGYLIRRTITGMRIR